MFLGTSDHTLDQKNRLVLPAKFRPDLAGGGVMAKGIDGCLTIFRTEDFVTMTGPVRDGWDVDEVRRSTARTRLAGAESFELDGQGRITVAGHLKEYARLGRDVTITGVGEWLEVWDRDQWVSVNRRGEDNLRAGRSVSTGPGS